MLTLTAGAAIGMGGLTLAQTVHGHGKGPTVKTLSAVDVNEELNGKPARVEMLEQNGPTPEGKMLEQNGPTLGLL
ncbi:MAG: hypothetical protein ACXVBO_08850 [Isosphaeraceae bacterium]